MPHGCLTASCAAVLKHLHQQLGLIGSCGHVIGSFFPVFYFVSEVPKISMSYLNRNLSLNLKINLNFNLDFNLDFRSHFLFKSQPQA